MKNDILETFLEFHFRRKFQKIFIDQNTDFELLEFLEF